jgi:hypothetical protein
MKKSFSKVVALVLCIMMFVMGCPMEAFAFDASVTGDYGDKLIALLDYVVLIEVPKHIRSQRVRDRSYHKFGNRILPGGDLHDLERKWFSLTDSRPDTYVTDWLKTVNCPVIRINGTLPVENNLDYIVSVLPDETK